MPISFLDAVEFSKIPALNFVVPVVTSDPSPTAADEGRIIYNTTTDEFKYCNGTPAWVALGPAGAGGPPTGAASGDLTGSYPSPTIAVTKVVADRLGADTLASGESVAGGATGTAGTSAPALRAIGAGANQVVAGNDARLTNSRAPNGSASGDLTGTYPGPTIGNNKVVPGYIAAALIATGETGTGTTGTAATTYPALRSIGTGANQVVAGNDARLTDARSPSGTIAGDLAGSTWPTLNIGTGKVTSTHILDGTITDTDVHANNKDGAVGTASMRTLAYTAQAAMPGNARLDQIAAPTGPVALNGQKITGLGAPAAATDAATMGYVDSVAQGLDAKASVRAATTGNITISTALNSGDAIDGITLANGDRVLVKDQSTASQNGIYVVAASPARATDMDAWTEVPSAYTWVEAGTVNADTGWVSTADQGGTLDSTAIAWTQFSSAGSAIAGAGLTKTGNTFDIGANADATITVNANDIQVNSTNVEITSRKGQNNGYAALDGSGDVPIAQIPTGTTGTTVALGNHTHAGVYDPAGTASTAITNHEAAADPHTGYQKETEKGAVNGYAALDGTTKVPIAQVPTGTTASTVSLGNHNHDASYVQLATVNAKGDIYAGTADNTVSVLTVGANGTSLVADSTQATGLKWATVTGVNRFQANIGNGALTSISVTHSLGTRDLVVSVARTSTPWDVIQCGVTMPDTNTVTLSFASAPASNAYRVTILA